MRKLAIATLPLCLILVAATAGGMQTRQKKKGKRDFPTLVKEANEALTAKKFGLCFSRLRSAFAVAQGEMWNALAAGMPQLEGFTGKADRQNAGTMAAIGVSANLPFIYKWRNKSGGSATITIHANSAMVRMMSFALKAAEHDPNKEVIGYNAHKGVLTKMKARKRMKIDIPLFDMHLIQGEASRIDEDTFFKIFSQALVDFVAKLLGNEK